MKESEVKSRLRTALEAYGENPTSLSKKSGANQKSLNNHINGETSIPLSTILLAAEAMPEMSLEWLLRGVGEMRLSSKPSAGVAGNNNATGINNTVMGTLTEDFVNRLLAEKDKQIDALLKLLAK